MNNFRGFSLIELMITLAVIVVLLTVGVPTFNTFIKNNRLKTATNNFATALNLARSEAIKRGLRVSVCKSDNGATCAAVNGWDQGWIVFTDQNNNAAYNSASETLLRVFSGLSPALTLTGNGQVANYVSYIANGQSQLISGAFQAGTLSLCDDRSGNVGRDLVLSSTGRARLVTEVACP